MWKQLQAFLPTPKPSNLNICSHGQEACGLTFEQVKEVMEWLGLSLIAADYRANAHIIWDNPENPIDLGSVLKKGLRRNEPIFLHRCSDRAMPAPTGYYWRLMPEYLTLRMVSVRTERSNVSAASSSTLKPQNNPFTRPLFVLLFFELSKKVTRIANRDLLSISIE